MRKLAVLMVLLPLLLTACSSGLNTSVGLELVVRATSARLFASNPLWALPASLITSAALQQLKDDPYVRVADLEQLVVGRINWQKLTAEEQTILRVLISGVRQDIEAYLLKQGAPAPGTANVRVVKILTWINQTARLSLPGAGLVLSNRGLA